jgi:hypothetical protein
METEGKRTLRRRPQEGNDTLCRRRRDQRSSVFTRSPCTKGTHNGAPKRVTTHAGIAAIGVKTRGFRPENPSRTPTNQNTRCPPSLVFRTRSGGCGSQSAATTKVSRCPLLTTQMTNKPNHHHNHVARRRNTCAVHLPRPPPHNPSSCAR